MRFYITTSLLTCLLATVFATLTLPMMLAVTEALGLAPAAGPLAGTHSFLATLLLLPLGVLFGSIVALPAAFILGAIMLSLVRHDARVDRIAWWWLAGAVVALPSTLVVGAALPVVPDRILFTAWLMMTGAVGAHFFQWRWHNLERRVTRCQTAAPPIPRVNL